MASTRPYSPSDRAAALDLVGDSRAIDGAEHRVRMASNGSGMAIWLQPQSGVPLLGPVLIKTPNRRLFYELVQSCADDALALGHTRGEFIITDSRLLTLVQRDFAVDVEVRGRDPVSGDPTEWRVEVDIADALRQLGTVLHG